jgi:hypothetical protein
MPIARLPNRQYTLTNSVSCATLTLTSAEVGPKEPTVIMPIARFPHRQTNSVSCATLTLTCAEVGPKEPTVIMPIARLPHRQYTLTNCLIANINPNKCGGRSLRTYSNYANSKASSSPVHSYKFWLMQNINPKKCGGRSYRTYCLVSLPLAMLSHRQ